MKLHMWFQSRASDPLADPLHRCLDPALCCCLLTLISQVQIGDPEGKANIIEHADVAKPARGRGRQQPLVRREVHFPWDEPGGDCGDRGKGEDR